MNDTEKKQLEGSNKDVSLSLDSAKQLVAEMSDILHQDSKYHGDGGLRYFMNAVEGSLDLLERSEKTDDSSKIVDDISIKYNLFKIRVNLINGECRGVQVLSDLEDSFDINELFDGIEGKKVVSLGLQPVGANFDDKQYAWSNGEYLQVEVLNLDDQDLYLEYIFNNNLSFKGEDVVVLSKDGSIDKIFASLLLQGLIDINTEQMNYVKNLIETKSEDELFDAIKDLDIERIRLILESKKKHTKKIRNLSKDGSRRVGEVLDAESVGKLIEDLKEELKNKENPDKRNILSLVYKLQNKPFSEFPDELVEELGKSKSGILERIIVTVMVRECDPEENEDLFIKIFTKGSGDERVRWMIARYLSTKVPQKENNQKALRKFCGKGLRRQQKNQWDLALRIGIKGNYEIINEILEDILLNKKEPRYVYVKMIAVNNAESFFGDRWKDILQKMQSEDPLLSEAIKNKLNPNDVDEDYKKVELDIKGDQDRIKGALYAFAIGDCIGAPIEIMKQSEILEKYGEVDDFVEGSNLNIPIGEHTDDTELTLVILESILRNSGFKLSDVLEEYRQIANRHDEETDIDRHFSHATLMAFRRLTLKQHPGLSGNDTLGNGALIRIFGLAVLDMYDKEDNLYENIKKCCTPSHQSEESIDGAYLTALVTKYCLESKNIDSDKLFKLLLDSAKNEELKESIKKVKLLIQNDADYASAQDELGTSGKAIPSLSYALFCFLKSPDDFKAILKSSINIDGDSDSIGAVATSFYGALHGFDSLPKDLVVKIRCKDRIEKLFE